MAAVPRTQDPRQLLWVGVVLVIAAMGVAGLGFKVRQRYADVASTWTAAPATIVDHFGSRKPTFQFTPATGTPITTMSTFNNGKRRLFAGQSVTAYYNPVNPQEAALEGDGGKSIVWFLVSATVFGLGLTGIVTARRQLA